MKSILTWCRRHLMWSNSRQAWEERAGTLGLLAGAFALWWFGGRLSLLAQVLLWAVLLVVAAVLLRRGWFKLFGPVLFYDMVRSARRGRYILVRCLYAGLLFFIIGVTFVNVSAGYGDREVPPWVAANIAQDFFETLIAVQLAVVLLLTPAYVAGSIADEKNRKTLEFLLATDLRNREIVLSKLCSRLANLGILILTGLPILGMLQFLGGVDPNLVLAGFAGTGLTMVGMAGVSILASTYCKRPRDAIAASYLVLVAYYVIAFVLIFLIAWLGFTTAFVLPNPPGGWEEFFLDVLGQVARVFNAGNLIMVLGEIRMAGYQGQLSVLLPGILARYALFQGAVAAA